MGGRSAQLHGALLFPFHKSHCMSWVDANCQPSLRSLHLSHWDMGSVGARATTPVLFFFFSVFSQLSWVLQELRDANSSAPGSSKEGKKPQLLF